jgi:hypothetical protein
VPRVQLLAQMEEEARDAPQPKQPEEARDEDACDG